MTKLEFGNDVSQFGSEMLIGKILNKNMKSRIERLNSTDKIRNHLTIIEPYKVKV